MGLGQFTLSEVNYELYFSPTGLLCFKYYFPVSTNITRKLLDFI